MIKKRNIPVVIDDKQENLIFTEANKKSKPLIFINRHYKFAGLYYDMSTTDFILDEESTKRINYLMMQAFNNHRKTKSRILSGNDPHGIQIVTTPSSGSISNIRVLDCQKLAKQVHDVVMDQGNWVRRKI